MLCVFHVTGAFIFLRLEQCSYRADLKLEGREPTLTCTHPSFGTTSPRGTLVANKGRPVGAEQASHCRYGLAS